MKRFHFSTPPPFGSLAAQREEDEKASLLMEIRRSKDELFASFQKEVSVFREELANLKLFSADVPV
jgi:hypothetical protein